MSDLPTPDKLPGLAAYEEVKALAGKLLGPAFEEAGAIVGDHIRHFRLRKQLRLLQKTEQILKDQGLKPKAVSMKMLLPLLESAALEDDDEMSERWASLLASAADPRNNALLEASYIEILKQLPPVHAFVLDVFYEQINRYNIPPEQWQEHGVVSKLMKEGLRLDSTEYSLAIDNLLRLRLVDHPSLFFDKANGTDVRLQVTSAGILCATHLGKSFVDACSKGRTLRDMNYSIPQDSVSNVYHTLGKPLTNKAYAWGNDG